MIIEIYSNNDLLNKIVTGVKTSVNTIGGTMGPLGKTVIIDDNNTNAFTPSKDGFAVAKSINFEDKIENIGAKAVHKVCKHVADIAGDGTTTSAVLFSSMLEASANLAMANQWTRETAKGIDYAVHKAIAFLTEQSETINASDIKRIAEIATISTNGDTHLGGIVSEIISKVGADGVVSISDSKSMNTHYSYIDGMKLKQGFSSPHFKTSQEKEVCEMESVHILVYSGNIDTIQKLSKMATILEGTKGEPLLIFCSDMNNESVLGTLILNNARGFTKICVAKLPGFGDNKTKMAEDIATFVGGKFIDESKGMDLSKCTVEDLGKADRIIADANNTTIIGGHGSKDQINARCDVLRHQIMELGTSNEYQRNTLQERLAGLSGIAAVVHVGGIIEEQQKEIKYRLEDAIQAAKSAVQHGIIPGGASSLIRASKHIAQIKNDILRNTQLKKSCEASHQTQCNNDYYPFTYIDQNNQPASCSDYFIKGVHIVEKALCAPLHQILDNAGLENEWQTIINGIKTHSDAQIGYDVSNMKYINMQENGIIDPLSAPVEALKIAALVSSMLVMSHAAIVQKKDEKDNGMPQGMPGMY